MVARLLANEEMFKRKMTTNPLWPRCHNHSKSIMYMLRDREIALDFCNKAIKQVYWSKIFNIGHEA
jgi:hypothetical protein